jgi:hypothetical protein
LARALGGEIAAVRVGILRESREYFDNVDGPPITYERAHARIWKAIRKRGEVLKRRRKEKNDGK